MSRTLRLGLLGVGHIGTVHLQSATTIDCVDVVAAADTKASNRRRASELGAPTVYEEYEALVAAEDLDVVVVALPPFLHREAVTVAAEAGCHVFVEKPMARTAEEAREMAAVADRNGVELGVDHTLRYQSDVRDLKAAYDSGETGAVPLCYLSRINRGPFESPPPTHPLSEWSLDPAATGGGAVMDLGIHLFDLLEWFFGDVRVTAADLTRTMALDFEDAATVTLHSERTGTTATVHCGFYQWESPPTVNMQFQLHGVTGTYERDDYVPNFYRNAGVAAVRNVARRLTGDSLDYFGPSYYYRAHYEALRDFLTSVHAGEDAPVGAAAGLRAVELVEDVYRVADGRTPLGDREANALDEPQFGGRVSRPVTDGGEHE